MTAYRLSFFFARDRGGSVTFHTVVEAAQDASEQVRLQGGIDELRESTIIQRGTAFESTLRVLARVPSQRPHEWALSVPSDMATLLIPRVLWPQKAPYDVAVRRAIDYWDSDPREPEGLVSLSVCQLKRISTSVGSDFQPLLYSVLCFVSQPPGSDPTEQCQCRNWSGAPSLF